MVRIISQQLFRAPKAAPTRYERIGNVGVFNRRYGSNESVPATGIRSEMRTAERPCSDIIHVIPDNFFLNTGAFNN